MAPNLLLAAKRAVSPWEWYNFSSKDQTTKHPKLYFGKEPIKGIYSLAPNNKRYLVAIKPNGKPDVDGIFRSGRCVQDARLIDAKSSAIFQTGLEEKTGAVTHAFDKNTTSTNYHSIPHDNDAQHRRTTTTTTIVEVMSDSSRPTSTIFSDSGSSTTTTNIDSSSNPSSRRSSMQRVKSAIVSQDREIHRVGFIFNQHGTMPHQKSPFLRETQEYRRRAGSRLSAATRFRWTTMTTPARDASTGTATTAGLDLIDVNGYRFLARPLEVAHCAVTGRCMFRAEIEARTATGPVCTGPGCGCAEQRGTATCRRTGRREMFVLDDSVSWVVAGGTRRKSAYAEGELLYMVDEQGEGMRRQSARETRSSETRVRRMRGRFVVCNVDGDEDEDDGGVKGRDEGFASVLRYLGAL